MDRDGVMATPTRSSLVGNQRPEAERRRDHQDRDQDRAKYLKKVN